MATILFFDDWAVQAAHNVQRVMGTPTWVPEGTLEDPLTEGTYNFPFVWKDDGDGLWKAIRRRSTGSQLRGCPSRAPARRNSRNCG